MASELTSTQDWFFVFKSEGTVTVMPIAAFQRTDAGYVVGLVAVTDTLEPHSMYDEPKPFARFVEPPNVPGAKYLHLSQLTEEQVEASKRN